MLLRYVLILLLLSGSAVAQTIPSWWSGVLKSDPADNYAPANVGQLKNFAYQAQGHLNSQLDGGAGLGIETMVSSWATSSDGNYAPVNLGQLKAVADKFYSRLDEVGFDYKSQLLRNGYNGIWTDDPERPWDKDAPVSNNYAPANLGQLKILFSFDLTGFENGDGDSEVDSDGDGLPDAWEILHGLNPNNPNDSDADSDGDGLTNAEEYSLGTSPDSNDSDGDTILDKDDPNPTIQNPYLGWTFYATVPDTEVTWPSQAADYTKIVLKWNAAEYGPTGYWLECKIDDQPWALLATLDAGAVQYAQEGLLAGQAYTYRLTAFRRVGNALVVSGSRIVDYQVPLYVLFSIKTASTERRKETHAFSEFIQSWPKPKYYLTRTGTSLKVATDDWFDGNKTENYDPDLNKTTITFNNSSGNYDRSSDGKSGSDGHWHNEGSYEKQYWNKLGLTAGEKSTGYLTNSYDHSFDTGTDHVVYHKYSTYTSDATYEVKQTYTPTDPPAQWDGDGWAWDKGTYSWSGSRSYHTTYIGTEYPTEEHTYSSSMGSDGNWGPGGGYVDGLEGYLYGGGGTSHTTATKVSDDYSSTEVSNEYTTEKLTSVAIANLGDYPAEWQETWTDASSSSGGGVVGGIGSRDLSESEEVFNVSKAIYKLKAPPAADGVKIHWQEVFYPYDDPSTEDVDESKQIQIKNKEWALGSTANEMTTPIEVLDATTNIKLGYYQLQLGMSIDFEPAGSSLTENKGKFYNIKTGFIEDGWMPGRGWRIFPDAQSPTDEIPRNRVFVRVHSSFPKGTEVELRVLDVDDPTQNDPQHIIDSGDSAGESGDDNRSTVAGAGAFLDGSKTITCIIDPAGYARTTAIDEWLDPYDQTDLPELQVGMQPGDNYRVAVSAKNATQGVGTLQVSNKGNEGYVSPDGKPTNGFSGAISPLLTVWRKLHVEVDRMEPWQSLKPSPDRAVVNGESWQRDSSGTVTVTVSGMPSVPANFYAGGFIEIGGKKFDIATSGQGTLVISPANARNFPNPMSPFGLCELHDDDDRHKGFSTVDPLPYANAINDEVKSKFTPAYVDLEEIDGTLNMHGTIPFAINSDGAANPFTTTDDSQDNSGADKSTYWYHLLVMSYQGIPSSDGDPIEIDGVPGEGWNCGETGVRLPNGTALLNTQFSTVFVEVCRDTFATAKDDQDFESIVKTKVAEVTAHEIAHGPGPIYGPTAHLEGGLMAEGATGGGKQQFLPVTLKRIRGTPRWDP